MQGLWEKHSHSTTPISLIIAQVIPSNFSLLSITSLNHKPIVIQELQRRGVTTLSIFFRKKVDNFRSVFSSSPVLSVPTVDPQPGISQPLCRFSDISQQEVENIVRKMKPSTCALDPFPTSLVKSNICVIRPLIIKVINHSLQADHVPSTLKTAVIRLLLKKSTLDPDVFDNYRPISNLPFFSKVLEKVVAAQHLVHLKENKQFEKFQSGFRTGHSTETALVRVTNDLLMTADAGSPSLLILLHLSSAFDTVDHNILLHRLHSTIGLSDSVHNWFSSYLSGRTEHVALGEVKWLTHIVSCVVPQGSVLGPILFILYMLPLGHVISRHGIYFHCYADDIQLYIRINSTPSFVMPFSIFTNCLEEIKVWMKQNLLQLNSS